MGMWIRALRTGRAMHLEEHQVARFAGGCGPVLAEVAAAVSYALPSVRSADVKAAASFGPGCAVARSEVRDAGDAAGSDRTGHAGLDDHGATGRSGVAANVQLAFEHMQRLFPVFGVP